VVWGRERIAPGASGQPLDRTTAWNTSLPISPLPSADGKLQYRLASNVPDYWISFIHTQGYSRCPQVGAAQ
jgi:hypothetical protein